MPTAPPGYTAPTPFKKPAAAAAAPAPAPQAGTGVPGLTQNTFNVPGNTTVLDYSNALQPQSTAAPLTVTLPAGARVYTYNGSTMVAYEPSPGVVLTYDATLAARQGRLNLNGAPSVPVDAATWGGPLSQGVIAAGDADELGTMASAYPSFQAFWDSTITTVMGPHNDASKDAEVLKVIAQRAARPDMSDSEFQNLLTGTTWYQNHTQDELRWNDLGDAERTKQKAETADKMSQIYLQYFGVSVPVSDPRITNYLDQVASGKMGIGAFTEVVKTGAQQDKESPFSRQLRSEEEARLQRGVDIENQAQQIKDVYRQWGVQISAGSAMDMAGQVVSNKLTDADILQQAQTQAQILYPWKDPMLDTTTAAQSWLETYKRVLEKPADIFNPRVQQALTAGQPVFEFEKQLKMTDEWLGTQNGKQTLQDGIGSLGRRMGFE